ncbi:unnamed protein product [Symbiodinium sp. CCMP2592]|nr:unnamed protein product [Symbiodinium sp. CCMP2592]
MRTLRGFSDAISSVYRDIFAQELPPLRQITSDEHKDESKAMMYERTLPTKHVCALLVHALTQSKATQVSFEQHRRTSGIVFQLLQSLCVSRSGGRLTIRHLGTGAPLTVAANNVFSSEDVWAESVRAVLEEEWMAHCADSTRFWHRSTHGTMTIPEFVLFGLDGHGSLKRFSFLRMAAQDLLKQCFAALTHSCLMELSRPTSLSSGPAQLGTTTKVRKGAAVKAYFDACEMVASGDELDLDMIKELMEPEYQLYPLYVAAADSGHAGVSRDRLYVIMRHVSTTDCLYDPLDLYVYIRQHITERVATQPCDYMIGSDEEVQLEAMSVASVRGIVYVPGERNLRYLLNDREKTNLQKACQVYWERFQRDPWQDPNLAIFLGDNVDYSLCWSAISKRIPAFRLNQGKTFFPFFRRWMCASERLAALGMPVRPEVAEGMGVPKLPVRDIHRANQLAGNCMMLPTVALVQLVALSCVASKKATGSRY